MDADKVFKALDDPGRWCVLDPVGETNGQTPGQLCEHLAMARQPATRHICILERAGPSCCPASSASLKPEPG